jgi:hypothetical protein
MKLRYDGHGLNRADGPQAGERLITWQRAHAQSGGGYVATDAERRELGPLLAAAPDMLAALEDLRASVQKWAPTIDQSRARAAIAKAKGAP